MSIAASPLIRAALLASAVLVPAMAGAQGRLAATSPVAAFPDTCSDTSAAPKARVDACKVALKASKEDPAARHALGRALAAAGKHKEAAEEFERVIAKQPSLVAAYADLRDALVELERHEQAREVLERNVKANAGDADAHGMLARWLYEAKAPDTALVHVDHAIKLRPRDARLHDLRGDALYALDRTNEAMAAFREGVRVDPTVRGPHLGVAMILRDRKQYAEAMKSYDAVLRLSPKDLWVARQKAELLHQLKRTDEGVRILQAMMKADPENDETHFQLADFLTDRDRNAEALPHYEIAVKLDSTDATNIHDMGVTLARLGRPEEALANFRRAMALQPKMVKAYGNAYEILIEQEKPKEALEMTDAWRKYAADDDAGPWAARGHALRMLDRYGEARRALDAAIDRDSTHFGARVNRGIVALAERNFDQAEADGEAATRIEPERVNGWALRGFVAASRGNCADLVKYWGKANQIEPGFLDKDGKIRAAYDECRKELGKKKK